MAAFFKYVVVGMMILESECLQVISEKSLFVRRQGGGKMHRWEGESKNISGPNKFYLAHCKHGKESRTWQIYLSLNVFIKKGSVLYKKSVQYAGFSDACIPWTHLFHVDYSSHNHL